MAYYSGYHRIRRGERVDLGFLLGTRCYECSVGEFPCGIELIIRAILEIEGANGLSVFDRHIKGEGISAAAKLNVFLPADSKIYLAEKGL